MERTPKIILVAAVIFLARCSPEHQRDYADKLSIALRNAIDMPNGENHEYNVVVFVSDTVRLSTTFPMLSFPNSAIALGHLTRSQILLLCKEPEVLSVDTSKKLYPSQKQQQEDP